MDNKSEQMVDVRHVWRNRFNLSGRAVPKTALNVRNGRTPTHQPRERERESVVIDDASALPSYRAGPISGNRWHVLARCQINVSEHSLCSHTNAEIIRKLCAYIVINGEQRKRIAQHGVIITTSASVYDE